MEQEKLFINLPIEYYNDMVKTICDQEKRIKDLEATIDNMTQLGVERHITAKNVSNVEISDGDLVIPKPVTAGVVNDKNEIKDVVVPWWLNGVI